jgi:uncharacterized membrane protein YkoI
MVRRHALVLILSLAAALPAAAGAFATEAKRQLDDQRSELSSDDHDDRDHEAREHVRKGVERGELKSLAEVLRLVEPMLPGTVVGTEIENKNGNWLYEFRVVDAHGRLFDVYVDAATAKISKIKEK